MIKLQKVRDHTPNAPSQGVKLHLCWRTGVLICALLQIDDYQAQSEFCSVLRAFLSLGRAFGWLLE
jgi:hypothetical protein